MPVRLTCPQGHQWVADPGPNAETAGPCPVCGATVIARAGGAGLEDTNIETALFAAGAAPARSQATALESGLSDASSGVVLRDGGDTFPSTKGPGKEMPDVPGFHLLRELGRGGMGVVYLAHQEGLDRFVALKMILAAAHAGSEELMRFRIEAAAISRLQHPNLVQIYAADECDGRPYFALEFVDGGSLHEKFDGKPQPPAKAAQLVETLARAMHYAHQRGIVHRDLKPGNVLLTREGTPKITDFGLAKRMDSGHGQTRTGSIMGTPSYMAPEQAAGKSREIGPHTDVYALGAMLYEFLTGRPPFLAETGWDTIVQVINQEPVPPSGLQPKVPPDLETICLKCLTKDPRRRYTSAEALADDLARFASNEPILARPVGRTERLVKWVRRRPALAATVGFAAAAAVGLLAGGLVYHLNLQRQVDVNRQTLVRLDVTNGVRLLDGGDGFGALVWFAEALDKDRGDPRRESVHRMRYASVLRQCPQLTQLWFHDGGIRHASFRPDGRRVVTAGADGAARVWDVEGGQAVGEPLKHAGAVVQAWFSPDGRRVVTASEDGTARVWDAETGKPVTPPLAHGQSLECATFSPDGRRVLTAADTNAAHLWDAERGGRVGSPLAHEGTVHYAAFSPDGRRIVTAGGDRVARLWDAASQKPIGQPLGHEGPVAFATFSPDGTRVVTASDDHTARVWQVATGEPACPPLRHGDRVKWAAFSPDGRRVVTASDDDTAKVWDAASGRVLAPPLRHGSDVRRYAAFSPDGRWVVTTSDDNTARVWDAVSGAPVTTNLIHNGTVHCGAFSPDGRLLVSVSEDHTARLWDLATGSLLLDTTRAGAADANSPADDTPGEVRSADGKLSLRVKDQTAQVVDAATGTERGPRLSHGARIIFAAFSPDGRWAVTAGDDQTARVWDLATGGQRCPPLEHASIIRHAGFSRDGERVVTTSSDNTARVWDARAGKLLSPPLRHHGTVDYASFSPDGSRVATGSRDQTARVWDAATGNPITPSLRHPKDVRRADFSDDGRRLTTLADDGMKREWSLPEDYRPVPELIDLARLLAGSRIDEGGVYWPVEVKKLRAAWDAMRGAHPETFAPLKDEDAVWHRRMADECESSRQWRSALWHLDKLLAAEPNSCELGSRRGNARAELADWDGAAADYRRAREQASADAAAETCYRLALIDARRGETAGYRHFCGELLTLAGRTKDPGLACRAAAACAVSPAGGVEWSQVVRVAESGAAGAPNDSRLAIGRGAALYRAGRNDEAVTCLNSALKSAGAREAPLARLFLALAESQLGRKAAARQHLDEARRHLKEILPDGSDADGGDSPLPWPRRLELQLLRQEAESLLGPGKP